MMKYVVFILLFVSVFTSCRTEVNKKNETKNQWKEPSIANTKWECKIAEGCVDFYDFKIDSTYLFYSCEMEDSLIGTYHFKNDTLILNEKGSIYDNNYPEGSIHRSGKKVYWLSVSGNEMIHIKMSEWINGHWEKSNFKFDKSFIYHKVE